MRLIEQLGTVDVVTNISNRRQFVDNMINEWGRAIREKNSVCVLMVDVDNFERYVSHYGRSQGDFALRAIAATIKASLTRTIDITARWDRDKFSVLLPNADLAGAKMVGEAIRKSVESVEIKNEDNTLHHMTVSIGATAMLPVGGDSIEEIIRQADIALDNAKKSGKNKVTLWDSKLEK